MNMIKLICEDCGHKIEVFENEFYDQDKCEICGGRLVLDIVDKTETDDIGLEKKIIEEIKRDIFVHGNDSTFEIIEALIIPAQRIRYRGAFLVAGGVVPETDLFEEKEGKLFIKTKTETLGF
jgi:ribosomal protein S27E